MQFFRYFGGLFWQLYLSIVASLLVVGCLFFFMDDYINQSTALDDFIRDTQAAREVLLDSSIIEEAATGKSLQERFFASGFDVGFYSIGELTERLSSLKQLGRQQGLAFYLDDSSGVLLSVEFLPSRDLYFVIADRYGDEAPEVEGRNLDDYYSDLLLEWLGIALLLMVAGALLLQVLRLNRGLHALLNATQAWGDGELGLRLVESLPQPFDRLAQGFNTMATAVERTLSEQQLMTHAISHELRTPLSKQMLALELLRREHPLLDGEPLIDDLESYTAELEQITYQVLNLAQINNVNHSADVDTYLDLNRLLQQRIEALQPLTSDCQVRLIEAERAVIQGHGPYLQLALDNLLKNAFKYATGHVDVSLCASVSKGGHRQVKICVSDDGPGIAADQREYLLRPFARADRSRNSQSGGFGLGLAIVDAVMGRFSGRLLLEDSEAGGLAATLLFESEVLEGESIHS